MFLRKLIILFVLIFPVAYAGNIYTFSNDLTSETLSFNGSLNITRYLELPIYANVTTAKINISVLSGTCFQESANKSTDCGGLDTGAYSYEVGFTNPGNVYDEDYGTFGYSSGVTRDVFINYSKPTGATGAIWQVKDASLRNLTVTTGCYDLYPTKILLLARSVGGARDVFWFCYNNSPGYSFLGSDLSERNIYEEAIYWNLTNIRNSSLQVGNMDGVYEWNQTGTAYSNNLVNINTSRLNKIITDGCTCTGCIYSAPTCSVPFRFYSNTSGELTYLSLNVSYENTFSINISIRDSETNALITENTSVRFSKSDYEETIYTDTGLLYKSDLEYATYSVFFSVKNGTVGYSNRIYTVTLSNSSTVRLTAYLSKNTSTVTFTVVDIYTSEFIPNVLSTMYQYIGSSYVPIESHYSDITGRVQFTYQANTNYRFYFANAGYEDYIFYLNPILFSEYDVRMTPTSTINQSQDYEGISLVYSPYLFYPGANSFTFLIQSPDGELTAYGYTLTFPGGTDTQAGSNAIGSQLQSSFNITGASWNDRLQLDYYYHTDASGFRNFTYYYPIAVNQTNTTFMNLKDETYGLGIFERLLIATLMWVFIVGVSTLIGRPIPGLALGVLVMGFLVYTGFIPLWSIIISIFVSMLYIGSQGEA